MFVRDFIYVAQPFEVAAPRFVSDTSWLAPLAEEAAASARAMAAQLRAATDDTPAPVPPGRIRCEVGPLRARVGSLLVPLRLFGEHGADGFPRLAGDLEVAPVSAERSLVALGATYPRPTHRGEALQRIERATEAGVRVFLDGIATVLGRPLDA